MLSNATGYPAPRNPAWRFPIPAGARKRRPEAAPGTSASGTGGGSRRRCFADEDARVTGSGGLASGKSSAHRAFLCRRPKALLLVALRLPTRGERASHGGPRSATADADPRRTADRCSAPRKRTGKGRRSSVTASSRPFLVLGGYRFDCRRERTGYPSRRVVAGIRRLPTVGAGNPDRESGMGIQAENRWRRPRGETPPRVSPLKLGSVTERSGFRRETPFVRRTFPCRRGAGRSPPIRSPEAGLHESETNRYERRTHRDAPAPAVRLRARARL